MNNIKIPAHNTTKGEVMKNTKKSKVENKNNQEKSTKNCK